MIRCMRFDRSIWIWVESLIDIEDFDDCECGSEEVRGC
jgi:hypothetical protein